MVPNVTIKHTTSKKTFTTEPLTATFKPVEDKKTKKKNKIKKLQKECESLDDKSAIFNPTPSVLNSNLSKEQL